MVKEHMKLSGKVKGVACALLWLALAGVVLYQGIEINSLKKQNQEELKEAISGTIKRLKRDADQPRYTTEDCLNMHCDVGGAVYTRWGKTNCSAPGTELVYSGIVGGSHFNVHGGGANYLCLTDDPQWGNTDPVNTAYSNLYGAEFEGPNAPFMTNPRGPAVLQNHDVPCSVCRAKSRVSMVMIPGRRECDAGWTVEYRGYLESGHKAHKGRFSFVCVDEMPDAESSGYRNDDGALFYKVEAVCGSLPCPPYATGLEISCVVCTK